MSLLLATVAYLVLQFGVGIWASRRIHTESDYLVAGRRLGYPLAIFSMFATWFGAETIVGAAGNAYRDGLSLASAEPFAYGLCLILMGLVFAVPLWNRQLTTLADLFRTRFSVTVERVAAIILIPSSLLWAAAQIRAFGHVLTTTAFLNGEVAIAVAAGICILYTVFGGLLADAVTDIIQGILLIIGLLVLAAAVVVDLGGVDGLVAALRESNRLTLDPSTGQPLLATLEAWAIPVCGSVIATELVSRVIAARSPQVAKASALAAGGMYLAVGAIPVLIAVVLSGSAPATGDPEQFLPEVARQLLPGVGYAIFAGALISAILSTVDSTLLVASGLLSHNLVVPAFRITDERSKVRLARAGVMLFGIVAFLLARHAEGVFALVEQASAFGSAGVLVVVCFGLFSGWGGPRTALVTLVGGLAVYLAAAYGAAPYPFLLSLGTSLCLYLLGVLATRRLGV